MQVNVRANAEAGLVPRTPELRALYRSRTFLPDIKGVTSGEGVLAFRGMLEVDGAITVCGRAWHEGFPSYLLAPIRNLAEATGTRGGLPRLCGQVEETSNRVSKGGR